MSKTLKLSAKMVTIPAEPNPATVYVTFNRFDLAVLYVGTDKEAALDAKQTTDDICSRRTLTVTRNGDDFTTTLAV